MVTNAASAAILDLRHNPCMGLKLWCLVFAAALCLPAQSDPMAPLQPEVILLARVRNAARETLSHLPNYTCTLTVERSRRLANSRRYRLIDNIRLEVALVDGQELYAWPGAKRFEERELSKMVSGNGAISTGDFAHHARTILLSSNTTLTYAGLENHNGKQYHRWDFRVPRERSGYLMRLLPTEGEVGYSGSFWADPATMDLYRIEFTIDDIPPQLPLQAGKQSIEYARRRIGAADFLLPVTAEVEMTLLGGQTDHNRTAFDNCRQFAGESTLIFDEPAPETAAAPATIDWNPPANLRVPMKLVSTVDLKKSAVGDMVDLVVDKDVRDKGQLWLPKGAKVKARLSDIVCTDVPHAACLVALLPESFEFENKSGQLQCELESPRPDSSNGSTMAGSRMAYIDLVSRLNTVPPGAGLILIRGSRLSNGYSTIWRTLKIRE